MVEQAAVRSTRLNRPRAGQVEVAKARECPVDDGKWFQQLRLEIGDAVAESYPTISAGASMQIEKLKKQPTIAVFVRIRASCIRPAIAIIVSHHSKDDHRWHARIAARLCKMRIKHWVLVLAIILPGLAVASTMTGHEMSRGEVR